MTASIGHNGGPTFDDVVRDNLDRGLLLSIKEVIVEAVRDPRLERRHLRVLAEVIACINSKTGTAYPGRKALAESTRRYDPEDGHRSFSYTEAGIGKTLSELIAFGYLISTRRGVEGEGRALAHYTIRRPTVEELQDQITQWIEAQRMAPRVHPRAPDRTPSGNVTTQGVVTRRDPQNTPLSVSDVTSGRNVRNSDVTLAGNITPLGNVTSDVTSGGATVTRTQELGERTEVGASPGKPSKYPPPNDGEVYKDHGVYVNGSTIRHSTFVVSLSGIRMNTINSGLSANEVTEFCLGHALQWAAQIENGEDPQKVLPSKLANFLASSIMSAVNQRKIQKVRESRAAQPYAPRGGATANAAGPTESESDRTRRMIAEAMNGKR